MRRFQEVRDLPLRVQLMLAFALLAVSTTVLATLSLNALSSNRMRAELRAKSVQYARLLQQQLGPVLTYDDHVTARELFASLMTDRDLDGLAVYEDDGHLLAGQGSYPAVMPSIDADMREMKGHVIALAGIRSLEGRVGRVYVGLSTASLGALRRNDSWIAVGVALAVVLGALLLAVHMSRRIAGRLVKIAVAANGVAAGNRAQPDLTDCAKDEIGALAQSFNFMVAELQRLSDERARMVETERERLEQLVAERTDELKQSREMFRLIAESTKAVPFTLDMNRGSFPYMGAQGIADRSISPELWQAPGILERTIPRSSNPEIRQCFDDCGAGHFEFVAPLILANGIRAEMRWSGSCEYLHGTKYLRGLVQDITEFRRLGRELAAAQKLESVGRLAAGVAHEINTPVQFVSDNVHFVRTSIRDMGAIFEAYRELQRAAMAGEEVVEAARRAQAAEISADLDYIIENAPPAIDSAIEGLDRIAAIVRSMKQFAHPDQGQKTYADLNQAIQSTLTIARNEYKYVARLETDFGELPPVHCYLGEINQVVLNLLVNGAHAIADVVKEGGELGTLTVRTRLVGDEVEIAIGDTGSGIPAEIRDRVFDPFFTTKEVGKGTGQGLAIAHSVVVKKHCGTLRFESECGKGTTFYIRLPVDAVGADAAHPAAA